MFSKEFFIDGIVKNGIYIDSIPYDPGQTKNIWPF